MELTPENIKAILTQIQDEGDVIANSIATKAIEDLGLEESSQQNIELNESGHLEMVKTRTKKEELEHQNAMDKWAKSGGGDFDYSMN